MGIMFCSDLKTLCRAFLLATVLLKTPECHKRGFFDKTSVKATIATAADLKSLFYICLNISLCIFDKLGGLAVHVSC